MSAENSENAMAAYIKKELQTRKAEEINELLLDNCKSKEFVGLEDAQKFTRLNHISAIGCELESLKGLPTLPELTDVSQLVESLPNLYHLNLCGNPLKTIDQLKPLGKLSNLQALDVFDCPLTEAEGYRQEVFAAIPSLKFLDGFDFIMASH
ncbi:Acidic leucine-rich nuclear phosphoprotein 32 family member B-like, protein [Aphelenchoides fujianensis]|nr:Acidic leucine-rich nuclear phosphoprotein 32 family member B-like, protein [Aphelenchoides fujianensis]